MHVGKYIIYILRYMSSLSYHLLTVLFQGSSQESQDSQDSVPNTEPASPAVSQPATPLSQPATPLSQPATPVSQSPTNFQSPTPPPSNTDLNANPTP